MSTQYWQNFRFRFLQVLVILLFLWGNIYAGFLYLCKTSFTILQRGSTKVFSFAQRHRSSSMVTTMPTGPKELKDRMHITASRYVRYARSENISDGLMDLCICLESLLDSQFQISFRFGVCLTKLTGEKGQKAEEMATLLSELYDLRSKIAHGDPAAIKMLKQIEPKRAALHMLARRILTTYVFFMSEHLRHEWQSHVRSSIYA